MRIERCGTGAFMNDRQRKTAISIRGLIKRYPDGTVANRESIWTFLRVRFFSFLNQRLGTLEHLYRSMPKTYRLVYNGAGESAERASSERVVYDAADFEGVQKIIEERRLTEYSVRRISLRMFT